MRWPPANDALSRLRRQRRAELLAALAACALFAAALIYFTTGFARADTARFRPSAGAAAVLRGEPRPIPGREAAAVPAIPSEAR